jgi:hydrogenase maturation protease
MTEFTTSCLILACGNTLRSDDGVGPWLAQWAEEKFEAVSRVLVVARQQWTPDLAEDIAQSKSVLFIDCSVESEAGSVALRTVNPAPPAKGIATHHQGAAELLALAQQLYGSLPLESLLLTIGAGSVELGETFSDAVLEAIPRACALLEETAARLLSESPTV